MKICLSKKPEVISLRTSGKLLPGKKLAVYLGAVIAVFVLSYNLTKDLSFILISDKEGINLTFSSKSQLPGDEPSSVTCRGQLSIWLTICIGASQNTFNDGLNSALRLRWSYDHIQ